LQEFGSYLESGTAAGGLVLTPEGDLSARDTVWVGARDSESIALAARLGMNFIVGEAEIGRRQALLTERYRSAGGTGEMRGARLVCVAELMTRRSPQLARRDASFLTDSVLVPTTRMRSQPA